MFLSVSILLTADFAFSFGIFYLEFLDYYGESVSKTSMVGSVVTGMYMFVGEIVYQLYYFRTT